MEPLLPTPLMELLKKYYQNQTSEYMDLDKDAHIPLAYLCGKEDGKKELAREIFEYLGLINYN